MATPKFHIGEQVFAKMRGYAPWPARVEGIIDLTPRRITYAVYFYGSHQIGNCREGDLCLYAPNKDKYGKPKKRNRKFNVSVREADADKNAVSTFEGDLSLIISPEKICTTNDLPNSRISSDHENSPTDKAVRSMEKEQMLLGLLLDIQKSLGYDNVNLKTCLSSLDQIGTVEMNKLILMKNPEIVETLFKVKNYAGTYSEQKSGISDLEFKDKAAKLKVKAQVILNQIQSWFPCPYKKTFVTVFQEELEKFRSKTKNLTQSEIFRLTEDTSDASIETRTEM